MSENPPITAKEKTCQLLRYLKAFVGLRSSVVRNVEHYAKDGAVVWFHEMPHERDCASAVWGDGEEEQPDVWLRVAHQHLPSTPGLPSELEPWVDSRELRRSDSDTEPQLKSVAFIQKAATETEPASVEEMRLEDHPEAAEEWGRYLPKWRAWADEHRRKTAIQAVYARLFSIYQRHAKLGELYELVLGVGLLQWHPPSGESIKRHCITLNVELDFDRLRGEIRLRCAAGGARPRLEDEMLEADQRPVWKDYDVVEAHIAAIDSAYWPGDVLAEGLRSWVNSLSSEGEFDGGLATAAKTDRAPRIGFAPAIVLRKRGAAPTLRVYSQILEQLAADGAEPTFGLRRLVEDIDDDETESEPSLDESPGETTLSHPLRTYFPLPANSHQREIIERLSRRRGVLVQGPPGTGKSHTIANLICHLLAEGKRVLVTSETARALRVLKSKIPPQLRDLCVTNLGGDAESFRELESSVGGITRRQANFDRRNYETAAADLERTLDELNRMVARYNRQLRDLRKSETETVRLGNGAFVGTPSELGQRVGRDRPAFEWCHLEDSAPEAPPLSDAEFHDLVAGLRSFPQALRDEFDLKTPNESALPTPEEFASMVREFQAAKTAHGAHEQLASNPALLTLATVPKSKRADWEMRIAALEREKTELTRFDSAWAERALRESLGGRATIWRELESQTKRLLAGLRENAVSLETTSIALPKDIPVDKIVADASEMAKILGEGGKWWVLGLKVGRSARYFYLRETCLINGQAVSTKSELEGLTRHLTLRRNLETAWKLWGDFEREPSGTALARITRLEDARSCLHRVLSLADGFDALGAEIAAHQIQKPDWLSDGANSCKTLLHAACTYEDLSAAEHGFDLIANRLRQHASLDAHPIVTSLHEAVTTRNSEAWASSLLTLRELTRKRQELAYCRLLEGRLKSASQSVYRTLAESVAETTWDTRASRFTEAWSWSKLAHWLNAYQNSDTLAQVEGERARTESDVLRVTAELAAQKAWLAFLSRLNAEESNTLRSWRAAVRGIGKGTGKSVRVEHLRQRAREMATKAASSVPAWIMPRYKVAEMLEPHPEHFDVVIVDEASQSGIDSLFLFHIAKKIIVVGDIQQISPSIGFVDTERVHALQRLYLDGLPHDVALRPESSLYENAQIRFNGNIVLREHFRCMPEIIQFSNDLCYAPNGTPLDPLRNYVGTRLAPLRTHHVADGYRTGSSGATINEPEAKALVQAVEACIKDPRYARRSMGVISLQGEAQAQRIQQLLLERIGPEEIEKRDLVCGDAYAFQGDERDVIFLSLVAATNERIGVLSKSSDHQRFNVAASRARDQMWIFHSVQPEDLSRECVRYRLLSYMLNPQRDQQSQGEIRFESKFEEDVYRELTARGYAVRTQVGIGDTDTHRYRIDLVVEGLRSRLAVECDGDHWHGADRYEADMRRQRDLERMGWKFSRVRGSAFYSDPSASLSPVWERLKELGIGTTSEEAAFPLDAYIEDQSTPEIETPASASSEWVRESVDELEVESDLDDFPIAGSKPDEIDDVATAVERIADAHSEFLEETSCPQDASKRDETVEVSPNRQDESHRGPAPTEARRTPPTPSRKQEKPSAKASRGKSKTSDFSGRPYVGKSVAEMEALVSSGCDESVLHQIAHELEFRTTTVAVRLRERIRGGRPSQLAPSGAVADVGHSPSAKRPFFFKPTEELRVLCLKSGDRETLTQVAHELTFRNTDSAHRLAALVREKLTGSS